MPDILFTETWQARFFIYVFGFWGVICFIAGFWNNIHFLFSAMCGVMVYVSFNELKEK